MTEPEAAGGEMYAKGEQGMKAEDSVKWAASELGKIYS